MRWSGRQSARPDTADPTSDEADVATCRSGAHPALPYSEHSQSPRNRWQPVGDDANGLYQFQECARQAMDRSSKGPAEYLRSPRPSWLRGPAITEIDPHHLRGGCRPIAEFHLLWARGSSSHRM